MPDRHDMMTRVFALETRVGAGQRSGLGCAAVEASGPCLHVRRALASRRMTAAELEALLRVALPPLKLALRERYLKVRRFDPDAAAVAAEELAIVDPGTSGAAGWWN